MKNVLLPLISAALVFLAFVLVTTPVELRSSAEAEEEAEDEGMWSRLKRLDRNGDGRVTAEELGRRRRMLDRFDTDGDGAISKAEAKAARAPSGGGRGMGEGRRGGARGGGLSLETLDVDKDGSISQREWALFFEKADENKDKIIQRAEWDAATRGRPLRDDAPKEGSKAPAVSAAKRGTDERVDLSKPKRTTVLIFGSWT